MRCLGQPYLTRVNGPKYGGMASTGDSRQIAVLVMQCLPGQPGEGKSFDIHH